MTNDQTAPKTASAPQGTFGLFHVAGINVRLHWWWFGAAMYYINGRSNAYSSMSWNAIEYLSLFVIVLLHEFGHSLACRQVGGRADLIVLWPLGGVAFVSPPQRPGAVLWSLAAGPLVNVGLIFVLKPVAWLSHSIDLTSDAHILLGHVWFINLGLLIFNMLPIYPLDGGQILRALLWFVTGRARSLFIATIIGFIGVAALAAYVAWLAVDGFQQQAIWTGLLTAYIFMNCKRGWMEARALSTITNLPRHSGFACPSCGIAPPTGALWRCDQCGIAFDTFETGAECPQCHARFETTRCFHCGNNHPLNAWRAAAQIAGR